MDKQSVEKLEYRLTELERLIWGMFRVLETYITFNERPLFESENCEKIENN